MHFVICGIQVFNLFGCADRGEHDVISLRRFARGDTQHQDLLFQVGEKDKSSGGAADTTNKLGCSEKRKAEDGEPNKDLKKVGETASLTTDIYVSNVKGVATYHDDVTRTSRHRFDMQDCKFSVNQVHKGQRSVERSFDVIFISYY